MSDADTVVYGNMSDAETVALDGLSDQETIDYNPDVEFLKQIPSHPRERLRQKRKQNNVKFLKKVLQHP